MLAVKIVLYTMKLWSAVRLGAYNLIIISSVVYSTSWTSLYQHKAPHIIQGTIFNTMFTNPNRFVSTIIFLSYQHTQGYQKGGPNLCKAMATGKPHKSEWVQRWKCHPSTLCCCQWNCSTLGSLLWAAGNYTTTSWQGSRYINICN